SYGIQVARLAGLPKPIIERAKAILTHLEMNAARPNEDKARAKKEPTKKLHDLPEAHSAQLDLFQ
ncbi:MAG: hypothetical protein ACQKBY_09965, partial [Verrucomicrobiales bacterium]